MIVLFHEEAIKVKVIIAPHFAIRQFRGTF